MIFNNVSIMGMAHIEPEFTLSSEEIENKLAHQTERFGIRKHFIQELAGIKSRKFWAPGVQPSDAATRVAEKVLEKTGLDRSKLGIIINTSVCRDYYEPAVAALVHGNLNLPAECANYDITNACMGFLNGMDVAGLMLENGQIDYALIVDGESIRDMYDLTIERCSSPECDLDTFKNSFATLTLGSGAVAMILTRKDLHPEGSQFLGGFTMAATENNRLCWWKHDLMQTDSSKLLVEGIKLAVSSYEKALELLDWKNKKIDDFIFHQVGLAHIKKLTDYMKVDIKDTFLTFPEFGNMGPASLPFALSMASEVKNFQKGHRVAMMGIGSGLNCGMMEIVW